MSDAEQAYIQAEAWDSADYAKVLMDTGGNFSYCGDYVSAMAWFIEAERAYIAAGATDSTEFASLRKSMSACYDDPD